jgi:hypothetical protein
MTRRTDEIAVVALDREIRRRAGLLAVAINGDDRRRALDDLDALAAAKGIIKARLVEAPVE